MQLVQLCLSVLPKMDGAILGALTQLKCSAKVNFASAEILPDGKTFVRADARLAFGSRKVTGEAGVNLIPEA